MSDVKADEPMTIPALSEYPASADIASSCPAPYDTTTSKMRSVTMSTRRTGPREHGRQAARSTRDRPGGQANGTTDSALSAPPEVVYLIH